MADTLRVVSPLRESDSPGSPDRTPDRSTAPPPEDLFAAAGVTKGEVLAGRYRVEDVLGVGGMGAVLSTVHVQLGTRFAVKLVRPAALHGEHVVERFLREARAASRLTSPNAARIFDIGRLENGCPYMVMELLEGHDLKSLLQKRGPLDPAMAADCVEQACRALAEAHLAGIVHRDLKPSNLFLVTRGPQAGMVKVLDFGISKFLVPSAPEDAQVLTNPETTLGSPRYMAPEQLARPHEVDERVDVWSLGVTLYELLVGKAPFRGPTDEYIARAVMLEYPASPSRVRPDVPEALSLCVMRCLEKDRSARYPTASALAEAIRHATAESTQPTLERLAVVGPPIAPTLAGNTPVPAGLAAPSPPPPPPPQHASGPPAYASLPPAVYPSVPPPPRLPVFSMAPAGTVPPNASDSDHPPASVATPNRRAWIAGAVVVAALGAAGVLLVLHERAPSRTVVQTTGTTASTVTAGASPSTKSSVSLAPLPVDTSPVPMGSEKLKNVSPSVDTPSAGSVRDPLCTAAGIVCKRSYPECSSLTDYCEGKAHPTSVDAGAGAPNEHPVCTAARIVCDHRLEECDSLTRKCLVAQQGGGL